MPDTPEWLAERLRAEGQKTETFFCGLAPSHWGQAVYSEGACWDVRSLLAHFVATESSILRLVKNILDGGPGAPEGFDINAYNERKVGQLQDITVEDLLVKFRENRQETAGLVSQLSLSDLARTGRHPFLGDTAVLEILKLLYRHNQIHQRDIRNVLSPQIGESEKSSL
jgi:hypothetical protein